MIEMTTRKLITRIKKLEDRLERLDQLQIANASAILERLDRLENKQNAVMYNVRYPDD